MLDSPEADLEDIFTEEFYLSLVNNAYQGALAKSPLKPEDLPAGPRLTKRVEKALAVREVNNGRLNHFAPAGALMRQPAVFTSYLVDSTLDNAELLFRKVNVFLE